MVVDFFCPLFTYEGEFQVHWRATSKYIGSFYFCVHISCLLFWCCWLVVLLRPGKNVCVIVAAVTLGSDTTCHPQSGEPDSVEFWKVKETSLNYGNVRFLFHPINGFKHNLDTDLLVHAFYNCWIWKVHV